MDPVQQAVMDQWVARFQLEQAKAKELMEADPRLPYVSALVMASDLIGADKAWEELSQGMPFNQALWCIGSYGRLGFALKALDGGFVSLDELCPILPELWSGSDPDDTDIRFLDLWRAARWRNATDDPIVDGEQLPRAVQSSIDIYRGQDADAPLGIAWSTSESIARKFARGAATRQANRGGVVLHGTVAYEDVLAYLTGRGEFEIIVDPARVTVTK
jgi:hypothetical protein